MRDFNKRKTTIIRLRLKDFKITKDVVIETVFLTTKVLFVCVIGEFPVFVAVYTERDANRLMKKETKESLKKKEIEVQIGIELKKTRPPRRPANGEKPGMGQGCISN